jgi:hypothetical protein
VTTILTLSFYSLQYFRRYKRNVKQFSYPIIWRIRCNTTSKIYNQDRLKGLIESVALTTLDHNGSYLQELVISPCFFSRLASPIIACCLFVGVIANVPFFDAIVCSVVKAQKLLLHSSLARVAQEEPQQLPNCRFNLPTSTTS